MNYYQNQNRNAGLTVTDIERQIKNNQYKSKDELADYLLEQRKTGILNIDNGEIRELLNLYDSMHQKSNPTLDMSNYSAISLENEDIIVSQNQDRILTTQEGVSGYKDEFKEAQNEIIANNNDKFVSADKVFEKMATQEKEELSLMTLDEAFVHPHVSTELLIKIKFFITNIIVNPNIFRINIETGIFYNIENNEPYEVRKNEDTQSYEIFCRNEKIYGSSIDNQEEYTNSELEDESLSNEETLNKPKVRVRKPEEPTSYNQNAAFTKIGFLIMSIITFVLLTVMTILLIK